MSPQRSFTCRRGFTLIEVVTVLAILAVVSTMGTMAYFRVDQYWRAAYARTELHAAADHIFGQMRHDVNSLLSPLRTGFVMQGDDRTYQETNESHPYFRLDFADDQVTLPVEVYDLARGVPVRQRVTYRIIREGETPLLMRESQPLTASGSDENPTVDAAPALPVTDTGTLEFNVEYLHDNTWQDRWEGPGVPEALRVSLTLLDAVRPFEQVARKTIIPIHVD